MSGCDLRSDTLTKPTQAMLKAMFAAEVGDDAFAEDPTVRRLEEQTAALLGMEKALFVPSGTMANQIALALHTRPGDSVITEVGAHCVVFEAGASAALSGVQFDLIPRSELLSDQAIDATYRGDALHTSETTLLVVENTHNVGGGRVLDVAATRRIAAKARALNLAVHCDGARLWHAAAALAVPERDLVAGFTTVAVCFSKGLGAPAGSALCGPAPLIHRARKLRKMFGGGMRQVGYLAAAGLYALEHHRSRLVQDHLQAATLATGLRALQEQGAQIEVAYPEVGTNMVYLRFAHGAPGAHIQELARHGVRMIDMGGGWIRAVFHLDAGDESAGMALRAVEAICFKSA